MRILMTNADLVEIGGTQTWTETMARAFTKLDHDVDFYAVNGTSADKETFYDRALSGYGPLVSDVGRYDLVIANHSILFPHIKERTNAFCVFMSHGPRHRLEIPAGGADAYVCVSEEIKDRYRTVFPEMEVMRQPIDLEAFVPTMFKDSDVEELARAFVNCKNKRAMQHARAACVDAGYAFDFIHYKDRPKPNGRHLMNGFDLAITSGRGAVEALACGLQVCIYRADIDPRGYHQGVTADGWVTEDNIDDIASVNFSGRLHSHNWDTEDLTECLFGFKQRPSLRPWVEEHCDSNKHAEQFIQMTERVPA